MDYENLLSGVAEDNQNEKLAKKMHPSRFNKTSREIFEEYAVCDVPNLLRRRGGRRKVLTQTDKLDIVYEAIVKLRKHADIAKEY